MNDTTTLHDDDYQGTLNTAEDYLSWDVPIELYSPKSKAMHKLINNERPDVSYNPRHQWYNMEFVEPIFVQELIITFKGSSLALASKCEFKWECFGVTQEQEIRADWEINSPTGEFRVKVKGFIKAFSFRPAKTLLKSIEINRVSVYGYTSDEFMEIADHIGDLKDHLSHYRSSFKQIELATRDALEQQETYEATSATLSDEIAELEAEKEAYKRAISSLADDAEARGKKNSKLHSQEQELLQLIESREDALDRKRKEHEQLNSEITEQTKTLQRLKEDINIFPSEISGFAAEGAKSIKRYTYLALIPILAIAAIVLTLFSNAADLTVAYTKPGVDLWTIFTTRLPFVLLCLTILQVSYKLAKQFITEIIKINDQKLNLSKISIIATDVSDSASSRLGFEPNEIYQLRTELRMELLREHLKTYLPEDYRYTARSTNELQPSKNDESEVS